jgi:uncharacterized membrane protein
MGYTPQGPYIPQNYGFDAYPDQNTSSAAPYVEPDKAARTSAIFQGISGLITSAGDFYQRIKYNPQTVPGRGGDANTYWGGGFSYTPGASGEPVKIGLTGQAGFSPLLIIGIAAIGLILFLRK